MTYSIEDDKARGLSEVLINGILYRIHDGTTMGELGAEYDRMCRAVLCAEEMHAKQAEECERLRKSEAEWKYWRSTAVKACDRAEARLATAEWRLAEVQRALDETPYPCEAQRLVSAIEAVLAVSPAAPARVVCPGAATCQRTGCQGCADGPAAPIRTEAEQAVLDAMAEADVEEPSLRDLLPAVRAERARRGLK